MVDSVLAALADDSSIVPSPSHGDGCPVSLQIPSQCLAPCDKVWEGLPGWWRRAAASSSPQASGATALMSLPSLSMDIGGEQFLQGPWCFFKVLCLGVDSIPPWLMSPPSTDCRQEDDKTLLTSSYQCFSPGSLWCQKENQGSRGSSWI